jgi:glutathione synthase/RimK-type ligase-like ATP-grasp enzyme
MDMPDREPFRIALISARAARATDEDMPPLEAALRAAGAETEVVDWDDTAADWAAFDLALLRSPWDYTLRYPEFLRHAERIASLTRLENPLPVVRWNTEKRYLLDLDRAHVPIIPSLVVDPHENVARAVARARSAYDAAELVVKPTVGAGSRDTQRHEHANAQSLEAHVARLLSAGRSALIQPYLPSVDQHGETAVIFFAGRFSHAIRKGALLQAGGASSQELFAKEQIEARVPAVDELRVAEQTLAAIPFETPLYARIDLIRGSSGEPRVLEVELTEPSLFFAHAPGSAARFADAVLSMRSRLFQ